MIVSMTVGFIPVWRKVMIATPEVCAAKRKSCCGPEGIGGHQRHGATDAVGVDVALQESIDPCEAVGCEGGMRRRLGANGKRGGERRDQQPGFHLRSPERR
jgi:hypothetical protein